MAIKIEKEELSLTIDELETKLKELKNSKDSLKSSISSAKDYEGLNISGAGNILNSNLDVVVEDLEKLHKNMKNYMMQVNELDVDDFSSASIVPVDEDASDNTSGILSTATVLSAPVLSMSSRPTHVVSSSNTSYQSSNVSYSAPSYSGASSDNDYVFTGTPGKVKDIKDSTTITLPSGLGSIHTYMGWQMITDRSSKQYKLRQAAGMKFDKEGFAMIDGRYVVAVTSTFGEVGDYIDVVLADGTILKCIIGDIKSQKDQGCNKWGHNNGECVVEFVVDKDTWYKNGKGNHPNPGTDSCHPEWNQDIVKIINRGSYFDSSKSNVTNVDLTNTGAAIKYNVGNTPVTSNSGNANIDLSKYHNNLALGFEVTTGNKVYNLSDKDVELLTAIVCAESDKSYDDALAVMTTILNRSEAPNWIRSHGTNPVAQATAPNQFVVYQHGSYKRYMNGNANPRVVQAVQDALNGVRNHEYLSFRSNGTKSYSNNQISPTGNRYK